MGGGILPVAVHNGELYFLFGRENIRDTIKPKERWCDFGGGKEGRETYFETAAREGWEESSGFLGSLGEIKNLIKNKTITTVTYGGYKSFIFEIPYSEKLIKDFRKDFLKMKKNHPEKICKNGLYEKDMIKWVNIKDIKKFRPNFRPFYRKVIDKLLYK